MNDPVRMHEVLSVLAPPRRFELAMLLLGGVERSVSQLAEAVGLSQSCTTRHLQALERVGLVRGTRDGKRVVFRIQPADPVARSVLTALQGGAPPREAHAAPHAPAAPRRMVPRPARPVAARVRAAAVPSTAPAPSPEPVPAPPPVVATEPASPVPSESGISSAAAARRRSDLEDFLL
jgi:DNA-binding transcriptional ArsR family regulator